MLIYSHLSQEDGTQKAEIVFGTEEAARTACLLSNALIQDQPIFVYQKEDSKIQHPGDPLKKLADEQEVVTEAKGTATAVINSLLAAGYKLGEEIKKKALEYDGKRRCDHCVIQKYSRYIPLNIRA